MSNISNVSVEELACPSGEHHTMLWAALKYYYSEQSNPRVTFLIKF